MAAKKRLVIVGAGLCGSVLSALLRNVFEVTVIEQARKRRPLYDDVTCEHGEVNSSINRAAGLGGTTNYWHNALIELTDTDLNHAGIDPVFFKKYYDFAWSLFLSAGERAECDRIRCANHAVTENGSWTIGHMVVPYARANAWALLNERYAGDPISVVYGRAERLVPLTGGDCGHVLVSHSAMTRVDADYIVVCAGGLGTPVLLSKSIRQEDCLCDGYHDHPMAYTAKIKLCPGSFMKSISCARLPSADVRCGFVFEAGGMKTVFYLRPAMNMGLKSISGASRYILSDLRNDPFSPRKLVQLLLNLDAIKEAFLFKAKAGFKGDYYSILMLGEQLPDLSRGIAVRKGERPTLNWRVKPEEHLAYQDSFNQFMEAFSEEIIESNIIPPAQWEYRTAAHHSGAARRFLGQSEAMELPFFAPGELPNIFVCDASLLRSGGIANSGLTLVALSYRLAELIKKFI